MKQKKLFTLLGLLAVSPASAQGLYYVDSDAQDTLPINWVIGANVIYDDNVSPGYGEKVSTLGSNLSAAMSFVTITPQTTWDVYARLGLIYYFDAPASMDNMNNQSRAGVSLTHRVSERLRFSSQNFFSYELEPDYSYGYASSRQTGEYFLWQSNNSVGFRWSERFGTYTGVNLSGTTYADIENNDRFTWSLYNQFRYQLSPQTVLTGDYRYASTAGDGASSDSTDQFILAGVEHRFSPYTIGILRTGIQLRDVDQGSGNSAPYVEFALNSQINQQLSIRSFARHSIENNDTVQNFGGTSVEFDDRQTLRFGISGSYTISPKFSLFGGIDYIPTNYGGGREISPNEGDSFPDQSERLINAHLGLSVRFNDFLSGTVSYNYTNSSSDIDGNDYDRNRISLGLSAEF
jgi:hypothetical protein